MTVICVHCKSHWMKVCKKSMVGELCYGLFVVKEARMV